MASSSKKIVKTDNSMDYYSDNSTTTKTAKKRKEKRSDDDSPTEVAYKKKAAKEDLDKEHPPIATQHSNRKGKVKLRNTSMSNNLNCDENMDLQTMKALINSCPGKNVDDDSDTDYSSDSSHSSSGSESSAHTTRNEKTSSHSYKNTPFSNQPQATDQSKENHEVEMFVKECLDLKEGLITKKQAIQIKKKVGLMYNKILQLTSENQELRKMQRDSMKMNAKLKNLEQVIGGLTRTVQEIKEEAHKPASYASKLKAPGPTKTVHAEQNTRHAVIISPRDGSSLTSSEATKEVLMENLAPAKEKIRISGLKKISNNRVVVETTTKEEMERVLKNEKLQEAGLVAGIPAKKRPMIIVYDVPAQLNEEEFLAALRQQNLQNLSRAKFKEEVRLSHKTGTKDQTTDNRVIEVTPAIRETLLKQDRVYIGWSSLRVRDFISVSRCYKCQSYGHVSKYCRAANETCGHCGGEGHAFKCCPKVNDAPTCINCKRASRPCEHSSRSPECPAYKIALSNHLSKFDYGNDA